MRTPERPLVFPEIAWPAERTNEQWWDFSSGLFDRGQVEAARQQGFEEGLAQGSLLGAQAMADRVVKFLTD